MDNSNYKLLLTNLYFDLIRLRLDYDTGFDELVNGFEITTEYCLKKDWLNIVASKKTIELLEIFRNEWVNILNRKIYATIGVFMHLDHEWIRICNKSLYDLILSIKQDLNQIGNKFENEVIIENVQINLNEKHLLEITQLLLEKSKIYDSINPFYKISRNVS